MTPQSALRPPALAVALAAALATWTAAAQLQCSAGTITYHPGDGLKGCRIEADHQIYTAKGDRIRCKDGHRVVLHPNGEVESCTIAEPHVFAGVRCAGPGRVELNVDGTLRKCG